MELRTLPCVPDRSNCEPRLSVARTRRLAGRSNARIRRSAGCSGQNQPEPSAGPSNRNQAEPSAGPSNENKLGPSAGPPNENQPKAPRKRAKKHKPTGIVKEFCSNTTVHGLRYLTEPKRHWSERVCWLIAVSASIVLCSIMIRNIWTDWNENPAIMSFDDKVTSIDQIPYPAVTICPTKKFLKQKVNIEKLKAALNGASNGNQFAFKDLSFKELSQMNAVLQTCSLPHPLPADLIIPTAPFNIYGTIENFSLKSNSTLKYNFFKGHRQAITVDPIFTEDGLCFTFNSLNSHLIYTDGIAPELLTVRGNPNSTRWNREDGYQLKTNDINVYPHRVNTSDWDLRLTLLIGTVFDDSDKFCSSLAAGFHLSLHAPDELPRPRSEFIHIPPERVDMVFITPNMVTTSNELRRYDPHKRDCYFQSERQLRFFRSYSEQKCQVECLSSFTRDKCGCVHFAMPRYQNTKVCTIAELECYRAAKQRFDSQHIVRQCDCLPDCFSIGYHLEMSANPLHDLANKPFRTQRKQLFHGYGFNIASIITVHFKAENFISINRSESTTMWHFLSSCGGLLGVFMGVSVISIVEMIYYFTLRLFVNWKQQRKVQPIQQTQTICPPDSQGIVKDYFTNSNVHGLRYFTEPKRHWIERVFWMIVVGASIVFCGVVIQNIWRNWHENPVIVSFDDKTTSVDKVPFPAITVCPAKTSIKRKVDPRRLHMALQTSLKLGHVTVDSLSPEEISQLDAILQINADIRIYPSNFSIPSNTMIYDALRNIALEENSAIQSVNWRNQLNQFKFKPIVTTGGLCYTFNSLNSHEIYSNADDYPYRVLSSDVFGALVVRLGTFVDDGDLVHGRPAGLHLSLHAPDDLPEMKSNYIQISLEHDAYISIRPETVTTSNGLRSYSPHDRGCYFGSERRLHFFKKYSQQKCYLECHSKFSEKECGCTLFSLPREKGTRVCTFLDYKCQAAVKYGLKSGFMAEECDCLPDCTTITYNTELTQVPYHYYDDAEVKKMKASYEELGYLTHSTVHISFKENNFISVNRTETSTMFDFISNCGGLFGLFMGVSALSVVEVIYYFTLRWGVNLWRQRSDQINAAAVRIKRNCRAFVVNQWKKLREFIRRCGAFIASQWEKLKQLKRSSVAFVANQWDKLMKRKRDCGVFMMNQWEKVRQRFQ